MVGWAYVLMCTIYGTTFLAIKLGLDAGIPPFLFAALRFILAALILIATFRIPIPKTWKARSNLTVIGLLMTTAPYAALFWGEQYLPSGLSALLVATSPFFVILISITRARRVSWTALGGVGLGLAGLVLVLHAEGHSLAREIGPKFAIIGGELCFAAGALRAKQMLTENMSALHLNAWQMLTGGLGLAILALTEPWVFPVSLSILGPLAYLTLGGSIMATGLFYWLVQRTNPVFPSTWTYVSPVLAVAIGLAFRHEHWQASQLMGIPLILGGAVMTHPMIGAWVHKRLSESNAPQNTP